MLFFLATVHTCNRERMIFFFFFDTSYFKFPEQSVKKSRSLLCAAPVLLQCNSTDSHRAAGVVKLKHYGRELRERKYGCHPNVNRKSVDYKFLLTCGSLLI